MSSILVFDYDGVGNLNLKQTISTLGEPFEGDNTCADIHLTPDGRFLLAANQDSDSIVSFSIDKGNGLLSDVMQLKSPTPVCVKFF